MKEVSLLQKYSLHLYSANNEIHVLVYILLYYKVMCFFVRTMSHIQIVSIVLLLLLLLLFSKSIHSFQQFHRCHRKLSEQRISCKYIIISNLLPTKLKFELIDAVGIVKV